MQQRRRLLTRCAVLTSCLLAGVVLLCCDSAWCSPGHHHTRGLLHSRQLQQQQQKPPLPAGLTQQTRRSLPDPTQDNHLHAQGATKFQTRWLAGTFLDFRTAAGGAAFEPGALCAESRMSTACSVRRPRDAEREWVGTPDVNGPPA